MSACLTCDKPVQHWNQRVRYFCTPGTLIVPASYVLCDEHKNLQYFYHDIYEENGTRKEINHDAVIKRSNV